MSYPQKNFFYAVGSYILCVFLFGEEPTAQRPAGLYRGS